MLISGFHSIARELAQQNVLRIIMSTQLSGKRQENILLQAEGVRIEYKPKQELTTLIGDEHHQGILAEIKSHNIQGEKNLKHFITSKQRQRILVLDGITDTRNLGACLRSAAAFGVDAVIIPNAGSAAITHHSYKTSAGTLSTLPIFIVANLVRTLKFLQQEQFWVVGLDGHTQTALTDYTFDSPSVIVMGSEDKGMKELTRKTCDTLLKIPMNDAVESLNIAVAAGITLCYAQYSK